VQGAISVWNSRLVQMFAVACLFCPLLSAASEAEDRFLIMELMDRHGVIHDFGAPPGPDGEFSSITLINDKELGPQMLGISRSLDKYVQAGGQWKISRREIILESGNQALGKKYGFVR
jgi:hypothetical protein